MKPFDVKPEVPIVEMPLLENNERGLSWGAFKYRMDYPYGLGVRPMEATAAGALLMERINRDARSIRTMYNQICSLKPHLGKITTHQINDIDPFWCNNWLPGSDAAMIYTLIATRKPKLYLEVGSGNSTKFARRAIRDFNTRTKIVSIDPFPRAEIDCLCDYIIRSPVEELDMDKLGAHVEPGDIVFLDNSHRSFQNSDVTVCCAELLPALPAGCYYGVHDVFLPYDYPQNTVDRMYNEQYLLMMYLLGGAAEDTILASTYLSHKGKEFGAEYADMMDIDVIPPSARHGGVLWVQKGDWSRRFCSSRVSHFFRHCFNRVRQSLT
jgi:hypothetical protein